MRYADTLNARQFGAMISDGANLFMLDRRNVRSYSDIEAWNRHLTLLRRCCLATLRDMFGFDIPLVRHAEEAGYLDRFLRLGRNVDVTSKYRGLDLCCFKDPIVGFYLVKDADAW